MKHAAVPRFQENQQAFTDAVKQNLDNLTGQHKNTPVLKELATTATLAETIAAVNLIVRRLNGT